MDDFNYIPATSLTLNMPDYENAYQSFQWSDAEKNFSWYETGKLNIAYECIDRHCDSWKKNKVALYFTNNTRNEKYTFLDLKLLSNKFANVLSDVGIGKGDRVFIFMPRQPELYICCLGILKAGGIVGPLFEAFMKSAVTDRLKDSEAVALITTPKMLDRVDQENLPNLKCIFLVDADGHKFKENEFDYKTLMDHASANFPIVWMDGEDGMVLHYTSGSTGKPKGVLHVHNAMIHLYQTTLWVLDLRDDDIYWCTADPGWITGTSYGIFGPWLLGASIVVRGGRFLPREWYSVLEKFQVTVWYSAPTAFRMLMAAGDDLVKEYDLSSLRHVLSVGEPLNPEVVRWGSKVLKQRIHDTWWMTETGGQIIANYPCMPIKPGSMGKPFPGIYAAIIDDSGCELGPNKMGHLAIKVSWPAMMRQIWKNPAKYEDYFYFKPWYLSGDSAYQDEDGYFWFQGRLDDVINTSGERIGPFEVESKLLEHPAVAEAGVIGKPDPVRGEIIKAFLSIKKGFRPSEELKEDIRAFVKKNLSAHAAPHEIEFREKLPKTRSGKIMRRVLKAWELGTFAGDLSTMEE
ncbi:MAG: acetate--CoA ligase [Desulfitobacteriaceae bacterium]|nr:acetate--CoA ligase [Desulfitobacteriaceae bacterium]MDD4751682.1 acetate--CoA ligase [Desulfitobacteriaceae bacterium]